METKSKKTLWIFVATVAVLGLIGCCALAAVGAVALPAIARATGIDGIKLHPFWVELQQRVTEREVTEQIGA